MATDFFISAENNVQKFVDVTFKDAVVKYSFDFSAWADDNATITSVTWTVKSGAAAVSSESLTSNVATALVTFGNQGGNLIQIKAVTASNGTYVAYLDVLSKNPTMGTNDYGLCI